MSQALPVVAYRPWARGVHHAPPPPPPPPPHPPPPPPPPPHPPTPPPTPPTPTHPHPPTPTHPPTPPPPHPYKTMFFWTLRVSTIRNKMLTVKKKGLTTDLQLFSKGTLKTRIPNYRAGKILLWQLWPCNSAAYVLIDLKLVSNERWVFELSYQHKVKAKWPSVDKLQPL